MKSNDVDEDSFKSVKSKSSSSSSTSKENDNQKQSTPMTGFDGVVQRDRLKRKANFGPNSIKIRRPNNILIDIYGVITPWSFVNQLKQFAKENIGDYVKDNWNSKFIRTIVDRMWEQVNVDRQAGIKLPIELSEPNVNDNDDNKPNNNESNDKSNSNKLIDSTIFGLRWMLENKYPSLRLQLEKLCTDLWSHSFENGKLKADIYPDVVDAFHYWRFEEFIKIYSYASGPVDGQRQFLRSTSHGDLNRYIANGLNSSGGYKFDPNKYKGLCAALRESNPENLLYITDDPRKAHAAEQAGIRTVVINRSGHRTGKYDPKELKNLTVIKTLADIEFYNDPSTHPQCC